MAAAGLLLLQFHKYCKSKLKLVKEEDDRKIIDGLEPKKIVMGEASPKEIATIMRVYRDLKKGESTKD